MKRILYASLFLLLSVLPAFCGNITITPTTTLTAQTSNNTSAANSFPGCEISTATKGQCVNNGDLKASNVSTDDVHTLIRNGHAVKVYATYTPYWGNPSHPNIGYSSNDPAQVTREVADMMARGLDGAISDWYGPESWEDQATQKFKSEAEKHPPFTFALMIDEGAVKSHSCYPSCTATVALQNLISYARTQGYFSSVAAIRYNGKVVVEQFGLEAYSIDWTTITKMNPDLVWIFENPSAFTSPCTTGAYAWVNGLFNGTDEGLTYLTSFYQAALEHPAKQNYGATWKGFNDSVASWGSKRLINQNCGQTLLDTFNAANQFTGRLDAIQLVTWNDYEEGTELQSGVDNCVAFSTATLSGTTLSWKAAGDLNTVDHYNIWISTDGQNLMLLTTSTGNSLDLSQYDLAPGTYTLYIQAYGKPMFRNAMSQAVSYTVVLVKPVITEAAQPLTLIEVSASAGGGTYPVVSMAVYLDNVQVYAVNSNSLSVAVPTVPGTHDVAINAWDSHGNVSVKHQTVVVP